MTSLRLAPDATALIPARGGGVGEWDTGAPRRLVARRARASPHACDAGTAPLACSFVGSNRLWVRLDRVRVSRSEMTQEDERSNVRAAWRGALEHWVPRKTRAASPL